MRVPPEGPTHSPPLAIVGEAPGSEEERAGRPFMGSSGALLTSMLGAVGIPRGECYLTTIVKTRPLNNNFDNLYEDAERRTPKPELGQAYKDLKLELDAVAPKVIVALGAEALKALTGHASIKKYRGTMIHQTSRRILGTYAPSYILRGMYEERPIVEADLAKAYRQALNPYRPKNNFNINPTFEEVCEFLTHRPSRLALDIETVGMVTRMIGFAWSRTDALIIPFLKGREHYWPEHEEAHILYGLGKLLADPKVGKYIQNFPFDYTVLANEFGFEINNIVMDTMVAHHLLYPELPKGLDTICSLHTDQPMYWDYQAEAHDSTAIYCGYDNVVTFEAAEEFESQLIERGMKDFHDQLVLPSELAFMRIQSRGVKIDTATRDVLRAEAEAKIAADSAKLNEVLGRELNPWSPKQVSELVYDQWKLPKQVNPKTKKVTTDDDSLNILIRKSTNPQIRTALELILSCRKTRVYKSTFLEMNLTPEGRVRTSYNIAGTVTRRLSSSATIDNIGGNLQNYPRGEPRKVFIADPGKILIKADLGQAEYRVLIYKAPIERLIERLRNEPSFNIHMWNASENIYRVPPEQITKAMYNATKNGTFGANYGIGHIKVARMYNMELSTAKFVIERYHAAVPEVKCLYQKWIEDQLNTTRKLTNPFGWERMFMGRLDAELYRAGYSHYCQSTVADVINSAVIDLEFSTEGPRVDILLQVHDELVSQCAVEDIETGVAKVRKAMERPITIEGRTFTIPADVKVGFNWYDTSSLDEWKKRQSLS